MNATADFYACIRQQSPVSIDLELECHRGELLCLVGPSGSGKTTTLRLIAGLNACDSGLVRCQGQTWFDSDRGIHRERRPK